MGACLAGEYLRSSALAAGKAKKEKIGKLFLELTGMDMGHESKSVCVCMDVRAYGNYGKEFKDKKQQDEAGGRTRRQLESKTRGKRSQDESQVQRQRRGYAVISPRLRGLGGSNQR
ncbi:hypothetical protein MGYG_04434 [Nannizzia gypsea CBS 118893]|uniref:Uncharacterized protein n=1 Tax=Arthroderma gypseum (strain ATCC MYA-4604 / CBS 118893) TaxID=535722 RepID=E4USX8_ARTGP|nr:hypothetical protein MGYG_04434 [Nannizzia gypsea CBS 118893]EFR01427.1 hypothetical protein MGYG_04434 [Nannizzia gypsea CBS 118893]